MSQRSRERKRENNQNFAMGEELVRNDVMDEKFVKNFVMCAKNDPKVVMDLSMFKIGGWEQFATHQSKFAGGIH